MRRQLVLAVACALAISVPLVGCNDNGGGNTANNGDGGTTQSESTGDFDAVEAYYGQWRGSVEITGTTVYGTAGGSEPMLDINLEQDGTCSVEPVEAHADLPSAEGTWEGTENEVTLHLDSGDVVLSVADSAKLEGNAADFGIADFETINFDFYG